MTLSVAEAQADGSAGQDAEPALRKPLPPHSVLTYTLTWQDALDWERRDPVERKRRRALMAASFLGGIMLLSVTARHLPDWLSKLHSTALAFVILFLPLAAAIVVKRSETLSRARLAVPGDVGVRLELWDRRLVETRDDRATPLVIGAEGLRDVVETPERVFLYSRSGTIIVPATAFADAKAKDAFAGHWESLVK